MGKPGVKETGKVVPLACPGESSRKCQKVEFSQPLHKGTKHLVAKRTLDGRCTLCCVKYVLIDVMVGFGLCINCISVPVNNLICI